MIVIRKDDSLRRFLDRILGQGRGLGPLHALAAGEPLVARLATGGCQIAAQVERTLVRLFGLSTN